MRNNKYLLTGASGFLGCNIKRALENDGYEVVGLDFQGQLINVDITKEFSFDENMQFDIVVHSAGKAHSIPKSETEEKMFFDVNLEGTKILCNSLDQLQYKPHSFIFISTVAVYGKESGVLIDENYPLIGQTPYARSKILAEEWLTDWASKKNIKLGIIRLPLIAGPNAPGNLGAMISGIKSGKYLSIGKADAKKSMIWQEDIPKILPSLAQIGGVYNLTDGKHPTFKELELVISRSLGKRRPLSIPLVIARILALLGNLIGNIAPINTVKLKKITSTLTFDDTKAQTILNWKPSSVLEKLSKIL